jgi:O-antigen ligase
VKHENACSGIILLWRETWKPVYCEVKQIRPSLAWKVLLIGAFGVVPFLFSTQLNDPVRYPHLLGLLLVCTAALVLDWKRPTDLQIPKWLARAAGIWLALHLIGFLRATNVPEAMFETIQTVSLLAFFVVFRHLSAGSNRVWEELARVVVVAGGLQALFGILQTKGIDPLGLSYASLPVGTHANPNQFGSACLLMAPMLVYAIFSLPRIWKLAGAIALGLLLIGMFLAGSRATWLALLFWALLLPVLALPVLWKRHRRVFWLGSGLAAVVMIGVWIGFSKVAGQKMGSVNYHFLWDEEVMVRPEHNSLDHRYIVWNRSVDMIGDHPLFGVGPGNWKVRIPQYGIKGFDDQGNYGMDYSIRPHNSWLSEGAELGPGGMLVWTVILLGGFFPAVRSYRREKNSLAKVKAVSVILGLSGFAVVALFSFPGERIFQSMFFWTWLALGIGLENRERGNNWKVVQAWKWVTGAVLLLALLVLGFRIQGDLDMKSMMESKSQKDWAKTARKAAGAGNWAITVEPVSAAPPEWYEGLALLSMGKNAEGLKAMKAAQEVAPWHLAVRTNLAAAYEMNGQHLAAAQEYEALLQTFPDFEESWLNLAVVNLNLGRVGEVEKCLQRVGRYSADPRYQAILEALQHGGR